MTTDEQWQEFERRMNLLLPDADRREAIGASNRPFVLANAFRLGLFNLQSVNTSALRAAERPLVLVTRVLLPGENVLHVAVVFEGDLLDAVGGRLAELKLSEQARKPEAVINKVRVYLHSTGIYLNQPGDPETIDVSDLAFGIPLRASRAYFADVRREADLAPVEVAYVEYLSGLLPAVPFDRLARSGQGTGVAALNLADVDFAELARRVRSLGALYEESIVARYHTGLNHLGRKHFVLLTGISGTGKTLLAKSYAYAAFGVSSLDLPAQGFFLIPVRPEWTEPAHLLGFLDAISNTYRRTPFLDALLAANENRHRPVFVCLDEMNLAQPEYYFADILSAMETGEPIRLHDADEQEVGIPRTMPWPLNLYITGTVNVDETTRLFSPKVLDRANVIDMSEVALVAFITELRQSGEGLGDTLSPQVESLLVTLHDTLKPHSLHFGYRVVEELARYMKFAEAHGLLDGEAFDRQIEQKILTKLRGGPAQRGMLEALATALRSHPHSQAVVQRMLRDVEECGSFQYWA